MTDYDELTIQDFKGKCLGVRLKTRGKEDHEIMFEVLVQDDEHWFVSKTSYSGCFWIDDLITQLKHARDFLYENPAVEKHQWGFKWVPSKMDKDKVL